MPSAYDELRNRVAEKVAQRQQISRDLHVIPGLVAASLAAHIGAPREQVIVGHFKTDGLFVPGEYEEHPQRVVFAVVLDFGVGQDDDFRLPVAVEAVVHADGYHLQLEGEQVSLLTTPFSETDTARLNDFSALLAPKLFSQVETHLGKLI